MKTVTRLEAELRLQINALYHAVRRAAEKWTPPPALINTLRRAAACRLSDPEESYWLSCNATDFMNESLGMDAVPASVEELLRAAGLTPEQTVRTRKWATKIRFRHQAALNRIPIDWMLQHT